MKGTVLAKKIYINLNVEREIDIDIERLAVEKQWSTNGNTDMEH